MPWIKMVQNIQIMIGNNVLSEWQWKPENIMSYLNKIFIINFQYLLYIL